MQNGQTQKQRVVITGTGMITPLGHNVVDTWAAILAGQSGFGPFTLIEQGDHIATGLCEVKGFDPDEMLGKREARRRDRYQQLAAVAAQEAMAQSGLQITDENRERIGVTMGTGVGGIQTLVEQEHSVPGEGPAADQPVCDHDDYA